MKTFKTTIPVNYYDLNMHRELSPVSLLNFLEETAIRHSKSVGYGVEKLLSEGKGWLLTRWTLQMGKYPRWGEPVYIETWPFSFERFYAIREFKITDQSNNLLGKATSLWIFFDLNRKRPIRIPSELMEAYGTSDRRMIQDSFSDLPFPEKAEFENIFRVRLSDIDTNNHVNNIKYVDWALESLSPEIHRDFQLSSLEVEYRKETTFGCAIKAEATAVDQTERKNSEPEGTRMFLHKIINRDEETIAAIAKTLWKKRC